MNRCIRSRMLILTLMSCSLTARGENRTYDGTGNNLANPDWGATQTQLTRLAPAAYADGLSAPNGGTRPNPRTISNTIVAQTSLIADPRRLSGWVFQWGQLVDHDLDLTMLAGVPTEPFPIPIPAGDPIFDPANTGAQVMQFNRSAFDRSIGPSVPRQQMNVLTSYLDASMVYGSDVNRANALREMSGGRLLTSPGNLLPFNTMNLPNGTAGLPNAAAFYVSGDQRTNEQIGLTAGHTLLMREHNRLAGLIAIANPGFNDEQIYQRARKFLGAEVQSITFNEFLPAFLGPNAPTANSVYDPTINPGILNEFSTAFFRVGHTMLSPELPRIQNDGSIAPGGHIPLRDAFFVPTNLPTPADLDYMLKGLASVPQQRFDNMIVDDVRNFLFGEPIPGGFDLASLNIQRGRDHGLPDYNTLRVALGLSPVTSFADITSDLSVQAQLAILYANVNDIDPWVGALSEDPLLGSSAGELITAAMVEQFTRLRDGDRFWYLRDPDFSAADIAFIESMTLSEMIQLNSGISNIQANAFVVPAPVPEPSTFVLVGVVAVGWAFRRVALRPSGVSRIGNPERRLSLLEAC